MASARPLQRSFAAGVISPELHGRLDLTRYQTGLAQATNWWILAHGPIQTRPGTEYVLEVKDSTKATRLIPFEYNTEQTFQIEFGDGYVRFHTDASTLLEAEQDVTGVTQAATGVLSYSGADPTNGDWFYLADLGGMTELNGRYVVVANVNGGANTFELEDFAGNPIDTSAYTAYTSGGTMSRAYTLTSPYAEADLFELTFTQSADVLTITHPSYATRELRRLSATNWQFSTVSFVPTISTPSAPTLTENDTGGTPIDVKYKVTAVAADTLEESLASAEATANIDLTHAGNYVDVDPPAVTGAVRYNVYKLFNGLYGYIGQTDGSAFRDNNVTPDVSKTPAISNTPFGSTDNYPGAVGYYESRRAFAGTNTKPQNYWLTRSATESNLNYSIPTRDDDPIAARIVAQKVHRIRHIVPLADLIFLTSGGAWRLAPQNSDILTPTSAFPKQVGDEGANMVAPVVAGSAAIYAQAEGGHVMELDYRKAEDGGVFFSPEDLSLMAPQLFDGHDIVSMAYQKTPNRMVWAVRDDGILLGLTYLPKHEVMAWHTHETEGLFECVSTSSENGATSLYAIVQRTINGRSVRYVERMHSRRFTADADAFCVDAGLTYSGAPTTTITGLHHLEGETVSILADGAVRPQTVVTDGAVALDEEASVVHVGLPYTCDAQTLPPALEAAQAFGQYQQKNVNSVSLKVYRSGGLKVGPDFNRLREYPWRTSEDYGTPPALRTGTVEVTIDSQWTVDSSVCMRVSDPLPATVLSMVLWVQTGG